VINSLRGDRGSAIVDFALIAPLLVAVGLGVVQVILAMHVHTVLTSAAAEGARAAALADADPSAGEHRARQIVEESIASSSLERITVHGEVKGGIPMMVVDIDARLPLIGMIGPSAIHVQGHSLLEHA